MARQTLVRTILDVLFPPRCVGCGGRGAWLCPACRASFRPVPIDLCVTCGGFVAPRGICAVCWGDQFELDSLRGAFLFDGVVRKAIHQLKYRGATALAAPLAEAMLAPIGQPGSFDAIVPVPLHASRLAQRGYNQSDLLARQLGIALGIAVRPDCLRRIRDTRSQVTLSSADRWQNVRGAFLATPNALRGASVLLVDDVATTGSTLRAAAAALKDAGVARVAGLVLARAP